MKNTQMYADGIRTDNEFLFNEAFAFSVGLAIAQAGGENLTSGFMLEMNEWINRIPISTFSVPEPEGTRGDNHNVPEG